MQISLEPERWCFHGKRELSAKMFFSIGCTFCLVGHSERRRKNISNSDVAESALSLQIENLLPVGWCHGDRYSVEQWIGPEKYC